MISPQQAEECARLKRLFLEKSPMSQREFAKRYNIGSAANLGHYLNGNRALNMKIASVIAVGLGIDVRDFSPRLADQIAALKNENIVPLPSGKKKIPLVSMVHAGIFTAAGQVPPASTLFDCGEFIYVDDSFPDGTYALKVVGNSMEPVFLENDIIVMDPSIGPAPGDFVVAAKVSQQMSEPEFVFKKYRPLGINEQGADVFSLVSLNPDYPTLRSDREQLKIIAVMIEHRRRYRRR